MRNAEQGEKRRGRCFDEGSEAVESGSKAAALKGRRAVLAGAAKSAAYLAPATLVILSVEARAGS